MFCPSSIAFAERQKLSKSTWKAIDCEAASTQKPAVVRAASQTVELPLLRTSGSPPRINRDHKEHHTRSEAFQLVSISACQTGGAGRRFAASVEVSAVELCGEAQPG